jgi:hypothetical protein
MSGEILVSISVGKFVGQAEVEKRWAIVVDGLCTAFDVVRDFEACCQKF